MEGGYMRRLDTHLRNANFFSFARKCATCITASVIFVYEWKIFFALGLLESPDELGKIWEVPPRFTNLKFFFSSQFPTLLPRAKETEKRETNVNEEDEDIVPDGTLHEPLFGRGYLQLSSF